MHLALGACGRTVGSISSSTSSSALPMPCHACDEAVTAHLHAHVFCNLACHWPTTPTPLPRLCNHRVPPTTRNAACVSLACRACQPRVAPQRLNIYYRSLTNSLALLLELAPLGRLRELGLTDYATARIDGALAAALVELCCSCSGLRKLTLHVGPKVCFAYAVDSVASQDVMDGLRAALALRGRAGATVDIGV